MTEVNNWNNYIKKGHSVTEAAKYFGVPYKSLLNLLNRHGLRIPTRHTPPHRKNPNNITYFDEINSHKKLISQDCCFLMDIFVLEIILLENKWVLLCNCKTNIFQKNCIKN